MNFDDLEQQYGLPKGILSQLIQSQRVGSNKTDEELASDMAKQLSGNMHSVNDLSAAIPQKVAAPNIVSEEASKGIVINEEPKGKDFSAELFGNEQKGKDFSKELFGGEQAKKETIAGLEPETWKRIGQVSQAGLEGMTSLVPYSEELIRSAPWALPNEPTIATEIARGAGSALPMMAAGAALAKTGGALAGATPRIAGALQKVGTLLSSTPAEQVAGAALGMGGMEAAKESGAGALGQLGAGLAGGLAGATGVGAIGKAAQATGGALRQLGREGIETLGEVAKKVNPIEIIKRQNMQSPITIASEDYLNKARQGFKLAEDAGLMLSNEATKEFLDSLKATANKYSSGLSKKVLGTSTLQDIAHNLPKEIEGMSLTGKTVEDIENLLSSAIDKEWKPRGSNKEVNALMEIRDSLRDIVYNPKNEHLIGGGEAIPLRKQALSDWAKGKKLQDMEDILTKAQTGDADKIVRSEISKIVNSPRRSKFYSENELDEMRGMLKRGVGSDLLSLAKSKLIPRISAGLGDVGGTVAGLAINRGAENIGEQIAANKMTNLMRFLAEKSQ